MFVLTGLMRITLPTNSTSEALISGGEFGAVMFQADTAAVSVHGHRTRFTALSETIGLTIPTRDGLVPEHIVLHDGACMEEDLEGLHDL